MYAHVEGASVPVTVRGLITDGVTVDVPVGKRMVVVRFEAIVTAEDGAWRCRSVKIFGRVLNSDGRPGAREANVRFYTEGRECPKWVRDLISGILPLTEPPRFTQEQIDLGSHE